MTGKNVLSLEAEYADRVVMCKEVTFEQVVSPCCVSPYSVERKTLMQRLEREFSSFVQRGQCHVNDFDFLIKSACDTVHPIMHQQTISLFAKMSEWQQVLFLYLTFRARGIFMEERLTVEEVAEGNALSSSVPELEHFNAKDS